jgi:hypothetical protein
MYGPVQDVKVISFLAPSDPVPISCAYAPAQVIADPRKATAASLPQKDFNRRFFICFSPFHFPNCQGKGSIFY